MEPKYTLKDEAYIKVVKGQSHTYGGSQNFFREDEGLINKNRCLGGCGIIAITDVISYLSGLHNYSSLSEYKHSFKKTSVLSLWIPMRSGINFVMETLGLKLSLLLNHLPYKCHWCFSKNKMLNRIKGMLSNNIPVILCIPKTIIHLGDYQNLVLYDEALNAVARTNGHFVVITGIYIHKDSSNHQTIYFSISSWGQKYYISYEEYLHFAKKHPFSLLGNIMQISHI